MQRDKVIGYLEFHDSKGVLQVFAQEDEDLGYELAMEIEYGSRREYVERIILTISNVIEIQNLKDIVQSDKFMIKFD